MIITTGSSGDTGQGLYGTGYAGGIVGLIPQTIDYLRDARVTDKPMDFKQGTPLGSGGAFSAAFYTGALTSSAGFLPAEIFQFRFVSSNTYCLLRSVKLSAAVSTTSFGTNIPLCTFDFLPAVSWTVQGAGGTGITWGANDGKKRTAQNTTVLGAGDVRIATTTSLGIGTKTLDAVPWGEVDGSPTTNQLTSIVSPETSLWTRDTSDEYPLLLTNNEGFVVRITEMGATGVIKVAVHVEWLELNSVGASW